MQVSLAPLPRFSGGAFSSSIAVEPPAVRAAPPRILVADPDVTFARELEEALGGFLPGVEVLCRPSGREAASLLWNEGGGGRFDLLILDLDLGSVDGPALLRVLARAAEPKTPVVIATADPRLAEIEREWGAHIPLTCVAKPIPPAALAAWCAQGFQRSGEPDAAGSATPAAGEFNHDLHDLVQTIHLDSLTCRVTVWDDAGLRGHALFAGGELRHAAFKTGAGLDGLRLEDLYHRPGVRFSVQRIRDPRLDIFIRRSGPGA